MPKNRLIGPEPNEGPEHHVVADGRSLGSEEEPDRSDEWKQKRYHEQCEEGMRRSSCGGDLLVECVYRLVELTDLLFGELDLRWAGGSTRTKEQKGDQDDPDQEGDRSDVSFVNCCSPFDVIVCLTI